MENTHVVIMAGGIGSRLWPLSTPETPKQFLDVLGTGKTLIQMTVERFLPVCRMENFWVVTSCRYTGFVTEQLPGIPDDHILAEPEPRNTAPCIAYACWKIMERYPDADIVVTPSDALVTETDAFASIMETALDFVREKESIVTVGIKPTRPETGYGYICSETGSAGKVAKVSAFKEKPDAETAMSYLASGNYYWNAGIFVWTARTIVAQMRRFAPGIADIMDEIAPSFYTGKEKETLGRLFGRCEKISIDYAVMEKSDDIHVIAGDLGWSDLGSWGSVMSHLRRDENGNAVVGDNVRLIGCRDCIVHVQDNGPVVLEGLEGCIVARKGDRMMVCRLSEEQMIKDFSAGL